MANTHEVSEKSASPTLTQDSLRNEKANEGIPVVDDSPAIASSKGPETEYITGIALYGVLFGVTLVAFLIMLDQTIIVTAIPRITSDFDSLKDIGWYGSAFMLSMASLQPMFGKIYQYYSSKYCFLTALALFELGSLICAVAKTSDMLIVGRAIAGMGSAGSFTGLLTILAASAPLEKRPVYLGFMLGLAAIGLVLGPVLGGVFTQRASWRWCFYINLPFGAITATILAFVKIPDGKIVSSTKATRREQVERLDFPGFAIFTSAIIMLLLAVEWGGASYRWNSAAIIGLLCGAAVSTVLFFLWEKRQGDRAMIPLGMLRKPVVFSAAITSSLSQAGLLLITYYLPVWFQVVKEASPTMGGLCYLPSVGSQIVGSIITGALTSRLGYYAPFAIAGCALTATGSGLLSTLTPHSGPGMWAGYQVITGFSRGLTNQQPITAIQAVLPKNELATGNSFIMFCGLLGGALFVSFGQTIFSNQLRSGLEHFAPEVNAEAVFAVGATAFRTVIPQASVPRVILAYNQALTGIFYLGVGAASIAFVASWGLGWTNIKRKKVVEVEV